jgi:hypothetical protein
MFYPSGIVYQLCFVVDNIYFILNELFPIAFGVCFTTTKSILKTQKIASKGGECCT